WLLENWAGLPHFSRPRHRLRIDLAHSAPDRRDRYQRLVGARSLSPFRSPILPAELSGTSAQFVSFSSCHPLMHFWLCSDATGIEFEHARRSSHGIISAAVKAAGRICDGKTWSLKSAKVAARVTPSLEQRRAVNVTEFERLRGLEEQ